MSVPGIEEATLLRSLDGFMRAEGVKMTEAEAAQCRQCGTRSKYWMALGNLGAAGTAVLGARRALHLNLGDWRVRLTGPTLAATCAEAYELLAWTFAACKSREPLYPTSYSVAVHIRCR